MIAYYGGKQSFIASRGQARIMLYWRKATLLQAVLDIKYKLSIKYKRTRVRYFGAIYYTLWQHWSRKIYAGRPDGRALALAPFRRIG